jgi:hypothetical protein
MTIVPLVDRPVGFTGLRRANSMAVRMLKMKTLGERLRDGYAGSAVYEHHKDSIYELCSATDYGKHSPEFDDVAKERLGFAAEHAQDLLTNRPRDVPAPTVEAWENGRIVFEWYTTPSRIVTASIDDVGRLAFAAQNDGHRGTGMGMANGQWPQELLTWIKRVTG